MSLDNATAGARLVLLAPALDDAGDAARLIAEAVGAADIAAVILAASDEPDPRAVLRRLKPAITAAQDGGAAALLAGADDLVGKAGADGVHVAGIAARAAAERFHPDRIVGAGALRTRDDAMEAGSMADYVMFGEPDAQGATPSFPAVVERVQWWAELFEPPCVGFAPDLDGVGPLAAAGADFVALGEAVWRHPAGVAAALAEASIHLKRQVSA